MKDSTRVGRLSAMETQGTDSSSRQRDLEKDVTDLIQIMGQTLNMALLYGVTHKVTRSSLEISFTVIGKFIEFHEHIHFSLADGMLLINGATTSGSPLAAGFTTRLTGLNLFSFTIEQGFSFDECIALFSLLLTPPAKLDSGKGAAELMESLGLKHVEAKSFSYRRVSEDETGEGDQAPTAPGAPAGTELAESPASPPADLDNIMAFLKDDAQADPHRSAEDIRQLAADTEKLAELILRTVEIRTTMANLAEGESLSDLIVGCIQKVVHPLVKNPICKTQKGRKQIKHSLLMLENALLDRLKAMAGDQAMQATESMMEEIVEDLDLDAIASKYMKNRRQAEKTSAKIAQLIERATDDPEQLAELHDRLTDQGLTPEGWQELTVKLTQPTPEPTPGPGTGAGGGAGLGDGANEIKVLTLLLARIGETIQPPPTDKTSGDVQSLVSETEEHLTKLAAITDRKINDLHSILTDREKDPALSRLELLEILAEIAQEIMQPLTIITGTASMIRSLKTGPLTEIQGELLSMISESADRLIVLANHLMHIAGSPEARTPDRNILNAAYQQK